MRPPPNAMSHGDGGSTTATFFAFTGMSAANAGAAAMSPSAAASDKATFLFIEPAPSRFDRTSADTSARNPCVQFEPPAAIDPYATGRALRGLRIYSSGAARRKLRLLL